LNNKPLVSAIVSTYNSSRFINGKIEDLLNQTIADKLEIIIINSGSQQDEDTIIKKYLMKHPNIKYIQTEERETIYKAWNRGITIANGKYITNANTDDRLRYDALAVLSNELESDPELGLVYADQYITTIQNENYLFSKKSKVVRMPEFDYLVQLERCIVFSQPMWRSSLHYQDNFWFDENLEVCGDHEFELKISAKYKMKHIPQVLGNFYMSPKNENKSFQNIQRIDVERKQITFKYLHEYVYRVKDRELTDLIEKFRTIIFLPMWLSRIIIRIKSLTVKRKHIFSQEFIYLISIIIYERKQKIDLAIRYCKKYLSHRNSWRIEEKYHQLKALLGDEGLTEK
jgi:glycosyltransferase involved in cell wall biosynthesis